MKNILNIIKFSIILTPALLLAGCNTSETSGTIEFDQSLRVSFNGTWASSCEYNRESGYYETIDYDINGNSVAIFISSYLDSSCNRLAFDELYNGQVSQTGTVILGNGLQADRLNFYAYDRENDLQLSHTAYFHADTYYLYEYPNQNDNIAFEYVRVL